MIRRSVTVHKIMPGSVPQNVETLRQTLQQCGEIINDALVGVTGNRGQVNVLPRVWSEITTRFDRRWREIAERSFELQSAAARKLTNHRISHHDSTAASVAQSQSIRAENERFWWVTRRGLEQATHARVALLKAGWFDGDTVHDLCCGIGGDALRLLERGEVHVVENDPLTAAMVSENLRTSSCDRYTFTVHCQDVEDYDLPSGAWLHLDPDRRIQGRAARDPDDFSPRWQSVCSMVRRSCGALIKLAPATTIPQETLDEASIHRLWIETSGSVREQDLLWGDLCDRANLARGSRSAWVVRADGGVDCFQSQLSTSLNVSSETDLRKLEGAWLIDPRPSIRAAGLTEAFATEHGCQFLAGPPGFLMSEPNDHNGSAPLESMAAVGRVEWVSSFDDRKLRKELRRRNCYPQTIKVRGADHDPIQLVNRYQTCGERPIRLWVGRIGKRVFAAITDLA